MKIHTNVSQLFYRTPTHAHTHMHARISSAVMKNSHCTALIVATWNVIRGRVKNRANCFRQCSKRQPVAAASNNAWCTEYSFVLAIISSCNNQSLRHVRVRWRSNPLCIVITVELPLLYLTGRNQYRINEYTIKYSYTVSPSHQTKSEVRQPAHKSTNQRHEQIDVVPLRMSSTDLRHPAVREGQWGFEDLSASSTRNKC